MSELVSVQGDECTHGAGALNASNNTGKVFIQGKKVVYVNSTAQMDMLGDFDTEDASSTGSSKVFAEGIAIHRNNDYRACGAQTIVTGQGKVFAG